MRLAGISTILVPTDFSASSEQALNAAVELARMWSATIELLHVSVDPTFVALPPGSMLPVPVDLARHVAAETERLEEVAARVRHQGLSCSVSTSSGRTHVEIVEEAVKVGAGLIVLGTHDHHGITHALLGNVVEKVLRHAPCPVLVVPLLTPLAEETVQTPLALGGASAIGTA